MQLRLRLIASTIFLMSNVLCDYAMANRTYDSFSIDADATVNIGFNYPTTGPYRAIGIQQKRGAHLAVDEINTAGGILKHQIHLIEWNSQSNPKITTHNVTQMIKKDQVQMVFGGSSSAVALAASAVCKHHKIPFFATLAYANEITGSQANRFTFRECYNTRMAAKALTTYLRTNLSDKTYFYITADYLWGHSTEAAFRSQSNTTDTAIHKSVLVPFPASYNDIWDALQTAKRANPKVLILVLLGNEMVTALKLATIMNLKTTMAIIVPSITLEMAVGAGPKAIEDVISTTPWLWEVPYKYNYPKGQQFVANFFARYGSYPSTAAASAYSIVYEYKAAVERAKSFIGTKVVTALEDHTYQITKDPQTWRAFDHQSLQTVYVVQGKFRPRAINAHSRQEGYFEILNTVPGKKVALTQKQWKKLRRKAQRSPTLETLPTP